MKKLIKLLYTFKGLERWYLLNNKVMKTLFLISPHAQNSKMDQTLEHKFSHTEPHRREKWEVALNAWTQETIS